MANIKTNWKADTKRFRAIFINGVMVMSTDEKDAANLAKAAGVKNNAAFLIGNGRKLGQGLTFKEKATNTLEIKEKGLKGEFNLVKNASKSFTASATSTVTVKVEKRGFIMGLISGKLKVQVKVKK